MLNEQGEEIGMTDVWISWEDTVDPQACNTNREEYYEHTRDKVRTPFQWDSSKNAGFSTADKTWLPLAEDYAINNIALQKMQNISYFRNFQKLIALRENPAIKYGGLELTTVDSDVLVYRRQAKHKTSDVFVIVLNRSSTPKNINLNSLFHGLPNELEVAVASIHSTSIIAG